MSLQGCSDTTERGVTCAFVESLHLISRASIRNDVDSATGMRLPLCRLKSEAEDEEEPCASLDCEREIERPPWHCPESARGERSTHRSVASSCTTASATSRDTRTAFRPTDTIAVDQAVDTTTHESFLKPLLWTSTSFKNQNPVPQPTTPLSCSAVASDWASSFKASTNLQSES